jgi:hypothetical protein
MRGCRASDEVSPARALTNAPKRLLVALPLSSIWPWLRHRSTFDTDDYRGLPGCPTC